MNILFIGPYRQTDAWGNMSKSLIKTLSKIEDYSLTIRPIFLSGETSGPVDADIIKHESNKKGQYDILIQHMLPNYMVYDSSFKQVIGITGFETLGCKTWDNSLDFLDKIFVTTEAERKGMSKELQSSIYSIGIANEQTIEPKEKTFDPFSFYCIGGDLESRGGVKQALLAYCSEFIVNDPVIFVLQTNNPENANQLIHQVYSELGMYDEDYYPRIHVVTDATGLHEQCNSFVDCSSSLGFNPETVNALSAGSVPIVVSGSGRDEYIKSDSGFIIESFKDLVLCPDRPMKEIFTAREECFRPVISSIKQAMRECFSSKFTYLNKSKRAKQTSLEFTHDIRASKIKEILCS
jgi:hypothetical protein